jgi:hypothetical protein
MIVEVVRASGEVILRCPIVPPSQMQCYIIAKD